MSGPVYTKLKSLSHTIEMQARILKKPLERTALKGIDAIVSDVERMELLLEYSKCLLASSNEFISIVESHVKKLKCKDEQQYVRKDENNENGIISACTTRTPSLGKKALQDISSEVKKLNDILNDETTNYPFPTNAADPDNSSKSVGCLTVFSAESKTPEIQRSDRLFNESTPATPNLSMIGTPLVTCNLREIDENVILSKYHGEGDSCKNKPETQSISDANNESSKSARICETLVMNVYSYDSDSDGSNCDDYPQTLTSSPLKMSKVLQPRRYLK